MKVLILVASSGKNLEIAQMMQKRLESKKALVQLVDLEKLGLPLYTSTQEAVEIPARAHELSDVLNSSDKIIIMSPEYNGGIPATLTNAVSWVSRIGEDWRSTFNNKPMLLGTHSGGAGANILTALRLQFSYIGANVIGRTVQASYGSPLNEEGMDSCLGILLNSN
jgi:NAD(P)H-dependent FMN reductase